MNTIISIFRAVLALVIVYLAWGLAFAYLESGFSNSSWNIRLIQMVSGCVVGIAGGMLALLLAGIAARWLVLLATAAVFVDTFVAYQFNLLGEPLWLDLSFRVMALLLVSTGVFTIAWVARRSKRKVVLLS